MRNIYITFSGKAFDGTTKLIIERARDFGADEVRVYDDAWLMKQPFYRDNRWIFDRQPQMGFGWCSWKPYLIRREWQRKDLRLGDVVLYTDADTYPIADLRAIFDLARREQIVLFEEQGCIHRHWTRKACFDAMSVAYQPDAVLACGRFQLFRIGGEYVPPFLKAWQTFSLDPRCQFHEVVTPDAPRQLEDDEVIRHSAEQSVLSVLGLDCAIKLHRTPDQNGWPVAHGGTYKPADTYPQVFRQVGDRGRLDDLSGSSYRNV